jgi:hypothetical protein
LRIMGGVAAAAQPGWPGLRGAGPIDVF